MPQKMPNPQWAIVERLRAAVASGRATITYPNPRYATSAAVAIDDEYVAYFQTTEDVYTHLLASETDIHCIERQLATRGL